MGGDEEVGTMRKERQHRLFFRYCPSVWSLASALGSLLSVALSSGRVLWLPPEPFRSAHSLWWGTGNGAAIAQSPSVGAALDSPLTLQAYQRPAQTLVLNGEVLAQSLTAHYRLTFQHLEYRLVEVRLVLDLA